MLPLHVKTAERIGSFPPCGPQEFCTLLERATREPLSDEEIVTLVNGTRDGANAATLLDFAASYRRPRDREVLLLPPLYFSSICENACAYCSFRDDGVRLELADLERELAYLLGLGFRSIELVSSQDPDLYPHAADFASEAQRFHTQALTPYVALAARMIRDAGGGMLTTNIPPLDVAALADLKRSGLDCFLVWQETFNPEQYRRLHVKHGPKGDQSFRLDSMENARRAGIEHLAGAFLKGLYDWRKEEVLLCLFDRHLKREFGRGLSIVGTPRVKGKFAAARVIEPYQVSDAEYEQNIALDRVLFDGILWLQTRESFEHNLALMERFGAGVVLTLVSSTAPGGYAAPADARPQFPVYKQDLDRSAELLTSRGFTVRFAWGPDDLGAAHRCSTPPRAAGVG